MDVLSGNVYAIPPDRIKPEGDRICYTVPVYDSPTFVTEAKLLTFTPEHETK